MSRYDQQHYWSEKPWRLDRRPIRRLWRENFKLAADRERLGLHGPAISPTRRNPERQMEVPGGAAVSL